MMYSFRRKDLIICSISFFHLIAGLFVPATATSQKQTADTTAMTQVIAGPQYDKSKLHRFFWGEHYRKEWITPVRVQVINLDSVAGGLTALRQGGGRQTKTLRLAGANGKEYVLRSIAKDFRAALPEVFHATFAEKIIKDQVSFAHPYAPLAVPMLAEAAGIYHTNPRIVVVPDHPRLGEYRTVFANMLCLFEERPDDDQGDAANFGYSKNVVGTEKMFEKVFGDNDNHVDQLALLRARLFDMFVGDWGRHEDQWRWASFDSLKGKLFRPVPRDRDQTFTKFDGLFPSIAVSYPQLDQLQTFSHNIRNVKKYNLPARYLDRRFLNALPRESWQQMARDLQLRLTDDIIERSVRQLPPELFRISGEGIVAKLRSRRDHLQEIAAKYYAFLAKEVEITGTDKRERFEVKRNNDTSTAVTVYKINKDGSTEGDPVYDRLFLHSETGEIRLYGLGEKDVFVIDGQARQDMRIRIIPGEGRDSVADRSIKDRAGHGAIIYDTKDNVFEPAAGSRLFISDDTLFNNYNYRAFEYDIKGLYYKPFLAARYIFRKEGWRKDPFAFEHTLTVSYSLFKNAFYVDYQSLFPQLFGRWGLGLQANLAAPNVENFFGVGNETKLQTQKSGFNRVRSTEILAGAVVFRRLGSIHAIAAQGTYHSVALRSNAGKFISAPFSGIDRSVFDRKHFAVIQASYIARQVNDDLIPTKGFDFNVAASYTRNLAEHDRSFLRYSSALALYLPITGRFSFATRAGGAINSGETEFYQLNKLGGSANLRGYRHQRFYGKNTFFNNNELRWLMPTRNFIFNGRAGLMIFFDNGRVWQPKEKSDRWHAGYGGGIILVPFNKLVINAIYAISSENRLLDARLGLLF